VPTGQRPVHVAETKPDEFPNEPAEQSRHDVAPSREYLPMGHLPEQVFVIKPDVVPNTPAGHNEQVVEDNTSSEVAPASAYDPEGQVTDPEHEALCKPALEPNLPAGQLKHLIEPGNEYVPAMHSPLQVEFVRPTDKPKEPAEQSRHDVAPSVEYVPAIQRPEQDDVFKPVIFPNEPGEHNPQVAKSDISFDTAPLIAYLPAGHVIDPEQDEFVLPPLPNTPAGHNAHVFESVTLSEIAPGRA
jgi:hypothetical protein